MTISSTVRSAGPFTGDGAQTVFPFAFKVFTAADLLVARNDAASLQTTLGLGSDYIVSLNADQDTTPGGYVTTTAALAVGFTLLVTSNISPLQGLSLPNPGNFYPKAIEDALDRLTILLQQNGITNIGEALRVPEVGGVQALPPIATRANRVLAFDASGNPVVIVGVDSGSAAALQLLLGSTAGINEGPGLIAFNGALAYLGSPDHTVGGMLYTSFGRTSAEISVGVTPANYAYAPGDVRRYGGVGDFNGAAGTENLTAFQNCINVVQASSDPATYATNSPARGTPVMYVAAGNYKITGTLTVTKKIAIRGEGPAERSSGSRLLQFNNAVDLIQVNPIAQGMSFSLEDITLAGTAGGAGHLVHVLKGAGTCNSQRYHRCFLASPPSRALQIDAGDDIEVRCVFDVSNGVAIGLGTATPANVCSNVTLDSCDWFDIATQCVLLYNVVGLTINASRVSHDAGRTTYFLDGYNTAPYQIKNVVINGGNLSAVDCIAKLTSVVGLTINGVNAVLAGAGAGATLSGLELTGVCSGVNWSGGVWSGNFDAKNAYNDDGATVTGLHIGGVTLTATGGTGAAIKCLNATGKVGLNTYTGFGLNVQAADYTAIGLPELTANNAQWVRGNISEEITLSTVGLTTDSAANLLPANSIIEAVVARVTTLITTTTDWKLGDATIAGRFAPANAVLAAGTTAVGMTHVDQAGTSGPRQTAASKLRITCTGANPGAGKIRVTVFYRQFVPPTT